MYGLTCCCCKIKNKCFLCGYGAFLLPMWIVLLVLGGIGIYASTAGKDELTDQCQDIVNKAGNVYTIDGEYSDINISLDIYETIQINKYMCTTDCPCIGINAATLSTWDLTTQVTTAAANSIANADSASDIADALNTLASSADYLAGADADRDVSQTYYTPAAGSSEPTFETYQACIQSYDSTATTPFGIWANKLNS